MPAPEYSSAAYEGGGEPQTINRLRHRHRMLSEVTYADTVCRFEILGVLPYGSAT